MSSFFLRNKLWLWPLIAMALIAPLTPALDLAISGYFFRQSLFASNSLYTFMFDYGPIPAHLLCAAAVIVLALSYYADQWKSWRRPALVLVLTMAVGAGLIVHAVLKDHWGRPRPKQIIEFGGHQAFRPFYRPNFFNQPEPSKSFSCGHCSMGFYFFAPALIARRYGMKHLFWTCLFLAFFWGSLLSLTRIAQGGHFFSDILVSALVMWLTAYACDWLIYGKRQE